MKEIIDRISIVTNSIIYPGKTLLFMDEIQDCSSAILALRYFYEKMPELHIIGAGSLLEFAIKSSEFRMPVGRITSIFMEPLNFSEFLDATEQSRLSEYLNEVTIQKGVDRIYKDPLEKALRKYLLIGGMPAIVSAFVSGAMPRDIQILQSSIIQTYQADFSKYATTARQKYLKDIFAATPRLTGNICKYSHINPNVQSRDLKPALELLSDARCIYPVYHSAGQGVPLEAQVNYKKFKLLFIDVGLMQRQLGLDTELIMNENVMTINQGNVSEQYIGQQLLSEIDCIEEKRIHFWLRESRNSQAEVDYLVQLDNHVFAVEVKSGKTGRLKSLRIFLKEHPATPFGIRFSLHELSWHDRILSIPLYMANHWKRFAKRSFRIVM
ncbi:MAG: ATP-binding protein, partial [Candidatus Magnetoglobus multicellularis str. Araruama]